jgi:hypothetical protein
MEPSGAGIFENSEPILDVGATGITDAPLLAASIQALIHLFDPPLCLGYHLQLSAFLGEDAKPAHLSWWLHFEFVVSILSSDQYFQRFRFSGARKSVIRFEKLIEIKSVGYHFCSW